MNKEINFGQAGKGNWQSIKVLLNM